MKRLGILACVVGALAFAEGFTFTIASPVAARDFQVKSAAFVFRTEGCADPAKAQIDAIAEGRTKGVRRSVPLKVVPTSKPGVFALYQGWPAEGEWVVNLKGVCANASAGAIIAMGPKGFLRESSKFYPRAATDAEIETALKTLAQGGNK
jgi:hypothetical protein